MTTLIWNGDYEGLYSTEIYYITTTYSVDHQQEHLLFRAVTTFKTDESTFSLVYDATRVERRGR